MTIMLEMAAATREQEMWERRFGTLYRMHPIWRTADSKGSWGLRDFLRYVGPICGFDIARIEARSDATVKQGAAEGESRNSSPTNRENGNG